MKPIAPRSSQSHRVKFNIVQHSSTVQSQDESGTLSLRWEALSNTFLKRGCEPSVPVVPQVEIMEGRLSYHASCAQDIKILKSVSSLSKRCCGPGMSFCHWPGCHQKNTPRWPGESWRIIRGCSAHFGWKQVDTAWLEIKLDKTPRAGKLTSAANMTWTWHDANLPLTIRFYTFKMF